MKSVFFSLLLLITASCNTSNDNGVKLKAWMNPNGKVKVLSTIAMIDDLVKQIGKEHIDSAVLIKGDLNPHSYQLVKGDDEKFAYADLIFANGLGLEHGPSLHAYLSKSKKATLLGNLIMEENKQLLLYHKGQLDPHIWMDAAIWMKTIPIIVKALSEKDPNHAQEYEKNGNQLIAILEDVDKNIRAILHAIPPNKRFLITSHDAFNYFTRSYLAESNETNEEWVQRFMAPEGLAPDSQISTANIQAIIDHLKKHEIHVLFPESNVNKDSIRKIVDAAQKQGLRVTISDAYLYADAMGKLGSEGDTYIKMITHNAKTIASHLNMQ